MQKYPFQPYMHPESHKPLNLLHPAHVAMHFSEQSLPKNPSGHANVRRTNEGDIKIVYFNYNSKQFVWFNNPLITSTYEFCSNPPDNQHHNRLDRFHLQESIGRYHGSIHICCCNDYRKIRHHKLLKKFGCYV